VAETRRSRCRPGTSTGWTPPTRAQSDREQVSPPERSRGVFDAASTLFSRYRARMVFRGKLIGGVPKGPKLIEGRLRARVAPAPARGA
jgi:hypothetical protein